MQTGQRELIVDADRCTGCKVCELACSCVKLGECRREAAHIKVLANEEMGMSIPVLRSGCDLCGECVSWCAPQALEMVGLEEATVIRQGLRIGRFPAVRMR